jgi:hypothetical protein
LLTLPQSWVEKNPDPRKKKSGAEKKSRFKKKSGSEMKKKYSDPRTKNF